MTYKLKDYLLEDKEYIGTKLSSGEKGILAFLVPELFVPIRSGNMGTHNVLFKTSLTNSGNKPENVHVKINYVPFMTFNNEKELNQFRSAINSHKAEDDSEDKTLKGIEAFVSKQKSRKGISAENEEESEEENEDVTEDIIPITYIEAKKASKKLGKLFNKLSKKNGSKIKKVLSKFQEASQEEKEKYEEEIYDLGLTKKNLNNLSNSPIPFSSSEEAKNKKVHLNTLNTKVGSDVSSDSLNPKSFEDLKDLQLYIFVIEGEENKETNESKDYFLKSLSLEENLYYLDKELLKMHESATATSFFDVGLSDPVEKKNSHKNKEQDKEGSKFKVLGRSKANKLIKKQVTSLIPFLNDLKKLNKSLEIKLMHMKLYDENDVYEELLNRKIYKKFKVSNKQGSGFVRKAGSKMTVGLIKNFLSIEELEKLEEELITGNNSLFKKVEKAVKSYYDKLKVSVTSSDDEIYQDFYMKGFNENFIYLGKSKKEIIDFSDFGNYKDYTDEQHVEFVTKFSGLLAYEIVMSSMNVRRIFSKYQSTSRQVMAAASTVSLATFDYFIAGGGISLYKFMFTPAVATFGQVDKAKKEMFKGLLVPHFDDSKKYLNKSKLNHYLRREIAISYKTIMFHINQKTLSKKEDKSKNPSYKGPYDNSFNKSSIIYASIGALTGLNSLTQEGIFDHFSNGSGLSFFDGATMDTLGSIGLNALWASIGVSTGGALIASIAAKPLMNKIKKEMVGTKLAGSFSPEMKEYAAAIIEIACNIKGIDNSISKELYESSGRYEKGQLDDIEKVFKKRNVLWYKKTLWSKIKGNKDEQGEEDKEKGLKYGEDKQDEMRACSKIVLAGGSGGRKGLFKKLFDIDLTWKTERVESVDDDQTERVVTKSMEKIFNKSSLDKMSFDHEAKGVNQGQQFFAYLKSLEKKNSVSMIDRITNICKKDKTTKNKIVKIAGNEETNIKKISGINDILLDLGESSLIPNVRDVNSITDPDKLKIMFDVSPSNQKIYDLFVLEEIIEELENNMIYFLSNTKSKKSLLKKIEFTPQSTSSRLDLLEKFNKDINDNNKNKSMQEKVYSLLNEKTINSTIEDSKKVVEEAKKLLSKIEDKIEKSKKGCVYKLGNKNYHFVLNKKSFKKYSKTLKGQSNSYQSRNDVFNYFLLISRSILKESYYIAGSENNENVILYCLICLSRSMSEVQFTERIKYIDFNFKLNDIGNASKNSYNNFMKVFSPNFKINEENLIFKDGIKSLIEG